MMGPFQRHLFTLMLLCAFAFSFATTFAQSGQFDLGDAGFDEVDIAVTASLASAVVAPGQSYPATVVIDIAHPWHINSAQPRDAFLIPCKVEFDAAPGLIPRDPQYPLGEKLFLAVDTMVVYSGKTVIPFTLAVKPDATPGQVTLPIKVTYQPCNSTECRAPKTVTVQLSFTIGGADVMAGAQPLDQSTQPAATTGDNPPAVPAVSTTIEPVAGQTATPTLATEDESDLARLIREHGFWGYFLALGLAFVTGLLLSFSPCTYPMVPITVSIFAGRQRSIGKGFSLSLVYVVSMAVVYGLMGLIVSLVGGVFGAWLASPPVVIAIVIIFVVFALSMFGLYELQVPMSLRSKLGRGAQGGGVFSVVLLGIVAALVVSPCVGPFVAGILIYVAASGSPAIGFLVLFIFALGLGTLYVLIGTFSSAINKLPGSGEWMESVKKFFGFVLLLMALYFVRTLIEPWLAALLTGLLLVAFGVFGGGLDRLTPRSAFFPRLKKFLGVLALIIGIYLLAGVLFTQGLILPAAAQWFPSIGGSTAPAKHLISWETELEQGLARAQREGKPVVIDTWATWCANCRVLEKETFGNPEVAAKISERFVPIKVQLENADTEITRGFMTRFGMSHYSLPTTLLLDSRGDVTRVLRGVIEPSKMIDELNRVS